MKDNIAKVAIRAAFAIAVVVGCVRLQGAEKVVPQVVPLIQNPGNSIDRNLEIERGMRVDALQRALRFESYQPSGPELIWQLPVPVQNPGNGIDRNLGIERGMRIDALQRALRFEPYQPSGPELLWQPPVHKGLVVPVEPDGASTGTNP